MAVEHMVWMKFKPGVSEKRIAEHLAGLEGLADKIDVIKSLKVGANFTDRAQGFTHGLIVTFNCRGCLTTYLEHPDHVAVAGPLKADAELMAMDVEV